MTNDETMTKPEIRVKLVSTGFGPSSLGLPSSFVIRHSSFLLSPIPHPASRPVTFEGLTALDLAVNSPMKRLIMSAAIGALALGTAMANRPVVEEKTQQDNADYEYVTVTGSHLKQKIKKRNIITVTRHGNLLTIDQKEMERNGNAPIADQLSRYPGVQISRH
jgi:hypothetical protein